MKQSYKTVYIIPTNSELTLNDAYNCIAEPFFNKKV